MTFTKTTKTAAFAKVHTDGLEQQTRINLRDGVSPLGLGLFGGVNPLGGQFADTFTDAQVLGLDALDALNPRDPASRYAHLPRLAITTEQLPVLQPLPNVLGLPHATYPDAFGARYDDVLAREASVLPQAARLWPSIATANAGPEAHAYSYAALNTHLPLWDPLNVFGVLARSPVAALGAPRIERAVLNDAALRLELTLAHPAWRNPVTSVIGYEAELAVADRKIALHRLRHIQAIIAARYFQHARLAALGFPSVEPIGHWRPFHHFGGNFSGNLSSDLDLGSVFVGPDAVLGSHGILADLARARALGDIAEHEIASLGFDSFYTYPRHLTNPHHVAFRILDNVHRFIERDDYRLANRLAWHWADIDSRVGSASGYDHVFEAQLFDEFLARRLGAFGASVIDPSTLYGSVIGRNLPQRLADAGADIRGITRAMFAGLFPSHSHIPYYREPVRVRHTVGDRSFVELQAELHARHAGWGALGRTVDEGIVSRLIRGGVDRALAYSLTGQTLQRDFAERLISHGVERAVVDSLVLRNIIPVAVEPVYALDSAIDNLYAERLATAGVPSLITEYLIGSQLTRDLGDRLQYFGTRSDIVNRLIIQGLVPTARYGFTGERRGPLALSQGDIIFGKQIRARVNAEKAAEQAATSAATAAATNAAANSAAATGLPSIGSGVAHADGIATPYEGRGTATAQGVATPALETRLAAFGIDEVNPVRTADALARTTVVAEPDLAGSQTHIVDNQVATVGDWVRHRRDAHADGLLERQLAAQLGINNTVPGAYRDWIYA
ncbi:hypothetical protein Q8F55_006687 [Vanrija albida]|uniref:Uncharacterized protein n=1 Tax=Vanrija albida TaxID=181172 RepID=A0ABR3PXT3_9TREE